MPEPESDKWRRSPNLEVALGRPNPYPTTTFPFCTEDEAYLFREPNKAYENGSMIHELPDGLQSDGTPPRHWGDTPVAHEDNTENIRHNDKKRGY